MWRPWRQPNEEPIEPKADTAADFERFVDALTADGAAWDEPRAEDSSNAD